MSSARAGLRPTPLVFRSAKGSRLIDIDGNEYVDYVAGYGPMLLGHAFEPVNAAVIRQMSKGTLFGGQHVAEAQLAELLIDVVPSAENVLLNLSGSEAVHAALRLARAATGRKKIIKFDGHYHGWMDPIASDGLGAEGVATGSPTSRAYMFPSDDVLVCRWNDPAAFAELMVRHGDDVAAVILEPVAANSGAMVPTRGYLSDLRAVCDSQGALLIFDEVVTGFRIALGGAQERFGVVPDLSVLGKAIASGHQLSAVVGKAVVMQAAREQVSWAGTMNGQALAVAAAVATISHLGSHRDRIYPELERVTAKLVNGINQASKAAGLPLVATHVGALVRLYWNVPAPNNKYENVLLGDTASLREMSKHLVDLGVHSREGGIWYVSAAHSPEDIDYTISAIETALTRMQQDTG